LFGKTKQGYYKQINRTEQTRMDELLILELINVKREIWKKGSGRNLHASLAEDFSKHKIKIGRDKFFELLRANGLLMSRKRRRTITTLSYHHYHTYPNIIKDIVVNKPNQVIVSDITYIWKKGTESFSYLFLMTDMYSRKILGYCISEDLKTKSAMKALRMAISNMSETKGSIHHSDRGIQYCSHEYTKYLRKNEMQISMTENGDPLENPIAERINRTIKEEFTNEKTLSFASFPEAMRKIPTFVKFYNEKRPHRSIEMLTPSMAYKMKGELKRKWKTYYPSKKITQQLTAV
jgi:putative transposase